MKPSAKSNSRIDSFGIIRVTRLRNAAARARQVPYKEVDSDFPMLDDEIDYELRALIDDAKADDELAEGWSRSTVDLEKFLGVFKALRLKEGFGLRAYEFRQC